MMPVRDISFSQIVHPFANRADCTDCLKEGTRGDALTQGCSGHGPSAFAVPPTRPGSRTALRLAVRDFTQFGPWDCTH
jgi:hypothetical protein